MKIDNRDTYEKLRGQLVIITFATVLLVSLSAFYDLFTLYLIPVNKYYYIIFFSLLFIMYVIFRINLKYHFIIYDDESDKIILRYSPLTSFSPKHMSIEIPYKSLYKIEINKKFMGFRDELTLYQTINNKIAKYKPIPLSGLSKKEKNNLINSLNSFAKIKINGATN